MNRPLSVIALSMLLAACATPGAREAGEPVIVGIAAINDFHGNLEPPRQTVAVSDGNGGVALVPAGGAAWLASAIDAVRAKYAHSVTVSAGDLIGASQIASALYLDEPAIGVMNRIGLDFNAVGNHEFDRGRAELLRMQHGGCARHTQREPCRLERFGGAKFRFLAASTTTEDGTTLFPATGIKHFGKGQHRVAVGFIGLTLKGTPELVSPYGVTGLTFGDEAMAINAAVPKLKAAGAAAVVVLIHQGGRADETAGPSGCDGIEGAILPILARLDPRIDVVVSGHTHAAYVCDYGAIDPARPILLTSAGLYGKLVTDIALSIDPQNRRVTAKRAANIVVQSLAFIGARGPAANSDAAPRFAPRADVAAYVGRYVGEARKLADRPVGKLDRAATRGEAGQADMGGPLGRLIADAQLAATAGAGAQIALTNPFGIRAPLVPAVDGSITFGMIHTAQPFGNQLVTQTLTGAEIAALLEQSFADSGPEQFLSPSAGFAYRIDRAAARGARIAAMTLNGVPIDPAARYRVTTNSFLAGGGDGFSVLTGRREATTGITDLEALEAWLKGPEPRAVPAEARVTEGR